MHQTSKASSLQWDSFVKMLQIVDVVERETAGGVFFIFFSCRRSRNTSLIFTCRALVLNFESLYLCQRNRCCIVCALQRVLTTPRFIFCGCASARNISLMPRMGSCDTTERSACQVRVAIKVRCFCEEFCEEKYRNILEVKEVQLCQGDHLWSHGNISPKGADRSDVGGIG